MPVEGVPDTPTMHTEMETLVQPVSGWFKKAPAGRGKAQ
jgi:hypothetical protein